MARYCANIKNITLSLKNNIWREQFYHPQSQPQRKPKPLFSLITMAKKKPDMAVFDAFDRLRFNENTKN